MKPEQSSELATVLKSFRSAFAGAAVFSFFINVALLASPVYMLNIYDRVLASRNVTTLVALSVVTLGVFWVYSILETLRSQVLVRIGGSLDKKMNGRVFSAVFKAAVHRPGLGGGQAIRDLDQVREYLTGQGIFAFFDAPWLPLYLTAVYLMHPLLGIVATIGGVLIVLLTVAQEMATRKTLGDANLAAMGAARFLENSLRNVEAITAMGMMPAMLKRWQERRQKTLGLQALASDRAGLILALSKFVRIVLQSSMMGFGAYLVIQNELTGGLMIAANILMSKALQPVEIAVGSWKQLVNARQSYARLTQLLQAVPADAGHMLLPAPVGALSLDRVVAAPPGTNFAVIKGITMTLAAVEALGIIGPSAAGKSSLARLIVGVWQPASGEVRLDGSDLRTWEADRLGQYIGYLPQDIELFEGTVAENIARFADIDAEAVIQAAQLAGVHDMILHLQNGYDTRIGPAGMTLSGGQRQRVGLARALYRLPPLIVLDEPNSNLDRDGEAALARAMTELTRRKITTIVITHRPSILASVSNIMVMNNGVVEGFGPRDEVLSKYMRPSAVQGGAPVGVVSAV